MKDNFVIKTTGGNLLEEVKRVLGIPLDYGKRPLGKPSGQVKHKVLLNQSTTLD